MIEHLKEVMLTRDEAASLLQVSGRTLGRWARMRKGPPRVKVGRSIYYRRAAIHDWLKSIEECD